MHFQKLDKLSCPPMTHGSYETARLHGEDTLFIKSWWTPSSLSCPQTTFTDNIMWLITVGLCWQQTPDICDKYQVCCWPVGSRWYLQNFRPHPSRSCLAEFPLGKWRWVSRCIPKTHCKSPYCGPRISSKQEMHISYKLETQDPLY